MKYYLVSYAYGYGFGRMFVGTNQPIDDVKIMEWEAMCAKSACSDNACIIAISEIDGPIKEARK